MVPSSWPHDGSASGPGGGGVWPDLDGLSQQELRALLQAHLDSPLGIGGPVDGSRSRAAEVVLPEPPRQVRVIVVRVDLDHARPAVWRRLRLRGDLTMDRGTTCCRGVWVVGLAPAPVLVGSGQAVVDRAVPGDRLRRPRRRAGCPRAGRAAGPGPAGCRRPRVLHPPPSLWDCRWRSATFPPATLQQAHGAHRSRTTALYTPGTPAKTW